MNHWLTETEDDRDLLVRTLRCPVCKAAPKLRCDYGPDKNGRRASQTASSHTGRYDAAVSAGLVPALGGVR